MLILEHAMNRLVDFMVVDESKALQPLELHSISEAAMFLSGVPFQLGPVLRSHCQFGPLTIVCPACAVYLVQEHAMMRE
jgi:hypothetical protein